VEDNGPGVPPHLVNRIFEPFFTTKEVGAGTGLGLSIAHTIMNEHKGRILYQTSSLGGAGFMLEFPVGAGGEKRVSDGKTSHFAKQVAAEAAHTGNILVLDDEKSIAEMLGELLGLLGHTATPCHLAMHALELLEKKEFDLIISDFRMPGMNGRQFYEAVLQRSPEQARRIIFLTGDVVNEDTLDFLKSTGNPHIAKPFNLSSVRTTVEEVLRSNRESRMEAPVLSAK
jgi:CheY-like chemotaxis protein